MGRPLPTGVCVPLHPFFSLHLLLRKRRLFGVSAVRTLALDTAAVASICAARPLCTLMERYFISPLFKLNFYFVGLFFFSFCKQGEYCTSECVYFWSVSEFGATPGAAACRVAPSPRLEPARRIATTAVGHHWSPLGPGCLLLRPLPGRLCAREPPQSWRKSLLPFTPGGKRPFW